MTGLTARIIRTTEDLQAITPAWWDLFRRAPAATPFQSPAWLVPWWQAFAPGELFTIAVECGTALVGLAPFYREDGALGRRLLPLGIALSDYNDVLLDPDHGPEAGAALISEGFDHSGSWDLWEWEELMPGAAALTLALPEGCCVELLPQSACPVLGLSAASLAECLPKGKRRKLNLARNRAARRGKVTIEPAGGPRLDRALDELFRLHRARWESRGKAGVLADDSVQRFHRTAASNVDAAGLLRFYTVRFGEEVVAGYYGFHHGTRAYAYVSGMAPDYEFESPGAIVMAHAIEQALQEGACEFHFLRGQEPYKYAWGAVDRWNQRRSIRRTRSRHAAA
jgi:CelD/BcsL family acetyltransferase involved in cellulose biosynthesis